MWQLNFKQYFLSRGGNSTTLQQQYSDYCGSHKNDDALSLLYFYGPCDSIGVVNVWPEDLLLWVPCFCPERIPKPSMDKKKKTQTHLQYVKIKTEYLFSKVGKSINSVSWQQLLLTPCMLLILLIRLIIWVKEEHSRGNVDWAQKLQTTNLSGLFWLCASTGYPKLYIPSTPNNSNKTHVFMCLGRAGRFGQH